MSETIAAVLGVTSGVLNIIGLYPYIRDVFRHKTKPERATWWIWLMLNIITFSAKWAAGSTWSQGLVVSQTLGIGVVAIWSLHYGYGTFGRRDCVSIVLAAVGVLLWLRTDRPLFALALVLLVDTIALGLTIVKTWRAPGTETTSTFVLSVAGMW